MLLHIGERKTIPLKEIVAILAISEATDIAGQTHELSNSSLIITSSERIACRFTTDALQRRANVLPWEMTYPQPQVE